MLKSSKYEPGTICEYVYSMRKSRKKKWLQDNLLDKKNYNSLEDCFLFCEKIYERAYSSIDLFSLIEQMKLIDPIKKKFYLLYFDEIRKEFRNEKLLIFYVLFYI